MQAELDLVVLALVISTLLVLVAIGARLSWMRIPSVEPDYFASKGSGKGFDAEPVCAVMRRVVPEVECAMRAAQAVTPSHEILLHKTRDTISRLSYFARIRAAQVSAATSRPSSS
jgi:hypothetical protein